MKIISWNCRGSSPPAAVYSLRVLIRYNNPDVLSLSETKASSPLSSLILNHLGFYSMAHVAHSGLSGGIVLAWCTGVELEFFLSNKHNNFAWCYSDPPSSLWIISCLYGPPEEKKEKE
jgi:exonuclease III